MPNKVSREVAIKRLKLERPHPDRCLICNLLQPEESKLVLTESDYLLAFLSKYPRYWGHAIVAPKGHFTEFNEIPKDVYAACFDLAREIAIKQEQSLNPVNIYISSIGSDQDVLNSCSHFHIHVLPIYDMGIKPSEVFSWQDGVFEGTEKEWLSLHKSLAC